MANTTKKYETIEDLLEHVRSGKLSLDHVKKLYYAYVKKELERQYFYREAIRILEHEKVEEKWGRSNK